MSLHQTAKLSIKIHPVEFLIGNVLEFVSDKCLCLPFSSNLLHIFYSAQLALEARLIWGFSPE